MEKDEIKYVFNLTSEIMKTIHQCSYQNLDKMKLYPGQPKLLALIHDNEGITQKELANKNFVKPATVTEMLNKLEANKYLYRVPDQTDKRIMRVYLTPEGHTMAERGKKFLADLTEKMFTGFTEEEFQTYIRLLTKIRNNL